MSTDQSQPEILETGGGSIAYETIGEGPLVVLCPGVADSRAAYRFLAPKLAEAGYTVVSVDLRGHGDSSTGWSSYTHVDTANDLIALVEKLGGPAVIVGQSFSCGAATIMAATRPELVTAVVEIGPFTRPPSYSVGALIRNDHHYRSGALLLARFVVGGKVATWLRYLEIAYPGSKPQDWQAYRAKLEAMLSDPAQVAAAKGMFGSGKTLKEAGTKLADVQRPVLVIMGDSDSDFAKPEDEARGIVGQLPEGIGQYTMIAGAGHYPHAQYPDQVAAAILDFLRDRTRA